MLKQSEYLAACTYPVTWKDLIFLLWTELLVYLANTVRLQIVRSCFKVYVEQILVESLEPIETCKNEILYRLILDNANLSSSIPDFNLNAFILATENLHDYSVSEVHGVTFELVFQQLDHLHHFEYSVLLECRLYDSVLQVVCLHFTDVNERE